MPIYSGVICPSRKIIKVIQIDSNGEKQDKNLALADFVLELTIKKTPHKDPQILNFELNQFNFFNRI
ncbi:MAG: hypothetical protein GY830_06435 [Bacteroidetes bacterium]|nr:hypothetical protein [Bacteroidota bacterium]